MQLEYITSADISIAVMSEGLIDSLNDALDLIGTAYFNGAKNIIIPQHNLSGNFFSLKTGFAGEILQKFVNYEMRLAIVGDFSAVTSNSLICFIRESNKGRHVFFKSTQEEAIAALAAVSD